MQTLQCWVHDPAKLQRLRDNLQDLPKKFRLRQEQPQDYLLGNVTGECNYRFTFRLEGGGFFQTGVLVASAEAPAGGMPIPLRCKWKRRVGDLPVEIPGVTSNMYQISADDVGTDIFVEAQPADLDEGYYGIVVGEIGPFELDPGTRRCLDNALGLGGSRHTVMQSKAPGDAQQAAAGGGGRQDFNIHIAPEGVRIVPLQAGVERQGREMVAEYSLDYPKVIIHPLDTSKFQLIMNETRAFHFVAMSRTLRDLIALTIRCFHAKKFLPSSKILEALLPVQPLVPGTPPPANSDSRLDACIRLERLTRELNRAMQQKEVSEKVLRNTNNEKKQLQAQLIETISGFTEVIEGLQEQFADGAEPSAMAPAPMEKLQEQLREANAQNHAAQAELQETSQKVERLIAVRKAEKASGQQGEGLEQQALQLREQRDMLQGRLTELSSSGSTTQQRDQADQKHTQELKGLRQDVEALHNQKEQIRRQLQEQDRERQELQENFLYVKGQLDKVQMRQANQASSSADGSEELQRHRQVLHNVGEERNRLSMRLEGVLREAEKEKAYHEQSLERVLTANSRLMEEKDRAAREVERLSQLYSQSVVQLQSGDTEHTVSMLPLSSTPAGIGGGAVVDPEELAQLRTQIQQADEALHRKEQENESLKNRIRKLAVA